MTMEHETGRSSLSVSQNAKGQFQLSGKVYAQASNSFEIASEDLELIKLFDNHEMTPQEEDIDPFRLHHQVRLARAAALLMRRNHYLESLVDLDGARQEVARQINQLAKELRDAGFTIAGDA